MDKSVAPVYRLTYSTAGQEISPGHMWGTLEAIATLRDCAPLRSSERFVPNEALDAYGFYFEETKSVYLQLDEPVAVAA